MTFTETDPIVESLRILERDFEARGWDLPAAFFEIHGAIDEDPHFQKIAELDDPLADLIKLAMFNTPPDEITGLVIIHEGYATADYSDVKGTPIGEELIRQFNVILDANRFNWSNEKIEQALSDYWQDIIEVLVPTVGSISDLPEGMYKEIRTVTAVARDGRAVGLWRTRGDGDDSVVFRYGNPDDRLNDVVDLMRRILGKCH
jgi:hypothetical protein